MFIKVRQPSRLFFKMRRWILSNNQGGSCTFKAMKIVGQNRHRIVPRLQYSDSTKANFRYMQFSAHHK